MTTLSFGVYLVISRWLADRCTSTYPTEMCTMRGSLLARSKIFNVWSQGLKMASRLEAPGSRNTASSEVLQCHSSREGFFRFATPLLPDRVPAKFTMQQTADNHAKLKVPKREIFVTELIILSRPIWIGDLRTKARNRFVRIVRLLFAILVFFR